MEDERLGRGYTRLEGKSRNRWGKAWRDAPRSRYRTCAAHPDLTAE